MSSRPQQKPHPVIGISDSVNSGVSGSMGASITGKATIITNQTLVGYSFVWSGGGAPVGVITVEVSNDYSIDADGSVRNAGTWHPLLDSAGDPIEAAVSGNTGDGYFTVTGHPAYAIRPKYTRTSGSGTMVCVVTTKVA